MTDNHRDDEISECRAPGAITREDLLAHATGQSTDRVAAHLSICPACRAEAAVYARLDHALAASLLRADCPSAMTLGEFALDLLAPEESTPIRAHVAICTHCSAGLSLLTPIAHSDPFLDMRESRLRRVIASLLPPSGPQLGAVALRGAQDSGMRPYAADGLTISLSVGLETAGPPRRWSLVGLVAHESGENLPPGGTAVLLRRGETVAEAALDEIDGMTFTDLTKGMYHLEVTLGDRVIVIDDVAVGDEFVS